MGKTGSGYNKNPLLLSTETEDNPLKCNSTEDRRLSDNDKDEIFDRGKSEVDLQHTKRCVLQPSEQISDIKALMHNYPDTMPDTFLVSLCEFI